MLLGDYLDLVMFSFLQNFNNIKPVVFNLI